MRGAKPDRPVPTKMQTREVRQRGPWNFGCTMITAVAKQSVMICIEISLALIYKKRMLHMPWPNISSGKGAHSRKP